MSACVQLCYHEYLHVERDKSHGGISNISVGDLCLFHVQISLVLSTDLTALFTKS